MISFTLKCSGLSYLKEEKILIMFHAQRVVNKSAPNYLVEILSNAVNVDKHYKLRNEDDIEQFQFRTENLGNH